MISCNRTMTAAKASKDKSEGPIEIRKYPNRRYYNTRESQHITLQEICDLVRDGHDIRVTDSRSGEDITGMVLTQILLELESPKLAFFPTSLLQHLIRINTGFLDNFAESYFQAGLCLLRDGRAGGLLGDRPMDSSRRSCRGPRPGQISSVACFRGLQSG